MDEEQAVFEPLTLRETSRQLLTSRCRVPHH